jgi:hypothetical protein
LKQKFIYTYILYATSTHGIPAAADVVRASPGHTLWQQREGENGGRDSGTGGARVFSQPPAGATQERNMEGHGLLVTWLHAFACFQKEKILFFLKNIKWVEI